MLEIRKQKIDQGYDLVSRTPTNDLQGGILDPPGFGRVLDRLYREFKNLSSNRIGLVQDCPKHNPTNAGIMVFEELHHQLLAHLASRRLPSYVATIDAQRLEGGNVADVVFLMMDITTDLIITGLLSTMETADECQAGILGQGLARQILFFTLLIGHSFQRKEEVVRLCSPQLLGQLVRLGKPGRRSTGDAQSFARDGIGKRVGHTPLLLVVTGTTQNTEGAIKTAGKIVMPLAVIHELAVLFGLFVME